MTRSTAGDVETYLSGLPADRRILLSAVRDVINRNLPAGYVETMAFGMIGYGIPLEQYPDTYNGQPLAYAALASQKNYCALYLVGVYQDPEQADSLKKQFAKAGKKLDMGKSCLRFRKLEDLPLDVIGAVISSTPPEEFIRRHEAARAR